ILSSLRAGSRVLVEKFSDVVVLCADVVGFSALAAAADTADCILTLNRLFSTFDALTDKMGVHKVRRVLTHIHTHIHTRGLAQVKQMLDLAREMLAAVDSLPYPDTLGKMQIRIGLHVGAVYGGVIGVKYPRYSLFGTTLRLAQGLQVRWFVRVYV
ncbi:guanylyl and adenylyl cyclase family member, partial [Volvox carteri f. nagariensis]